MSCKHPHFAIDEEWTCVIQSTVDFGKLKTDGVQTDGNPTGRYRFRCSSCGMDRTFTEKNMPKWATWYVSKIKDNDKS